MNPPILYVSFSTSGEQPRNQFYIRKHRKHNLDHEQLYPCTLHVRVTYNIHDFWIRNDRGHMVLERIHEDKDNHELRIWHRIQDHQYIQEDNCIHMNQ